MQAWFFQSFSWTIESSSGENQSMPGISFSLFSIFARNGQKRIHSTRRMQSLGIIDIS
jgi:hypothetical protein